MGAMFPPDGESGEVLRISGRPNPLEHTLKLLNFHPGIFDGGMVGSAATLWAVPSLNIGVPTNRFVRPC
jgi:hypothetical protein